ncbi:MAG TPA: diacylglycerol kinase family lipid kinase [Candidatus Alistipes excrementipullorum]|nr:diacylglycerol kinase family lipid kinase [Candidatus Alistipes excrementipullorum]
MPISQRWFVIVNPVAGTGRGLEDFPQISKLLRDNSIPSDPVFTEHKYHAVELTVTAVNKGYRKIIVIGGDGTLHEVVNGLFIQKSVRPDEVLLAVISVGTGNDWIRMFGIPTRYSEAIRAIREGKSFLQDVGEVTYEESQYKQKRYVANVAGSGFDAFVIRRFNHLKAKGRTGRWLYPLSIIRSFFTYKSTGVKVYVDDKLVYNDLLFSMAVGICKYNGSGILQLPAAVADDGLLDLTLIRPLHWWHIIFRLRKLFNGEIYQIGHVQHVQGSRITVTSSPDMLLEVDGELLGTTPLEFGILHRAIKVIVSKEFLQE